MPDQNQTNDQNLSPSSTPPVPPVLTVEETPPVSEPSSSIGGASPSSDIATPGGNIGGAVPPLDIPPVVTPPPTRRRFGGRTIATILGLLVLLGGLGAGLILTQQRQEIRRKAAEALSASGCQVPAGQTSCQGSYSWNFEAGWNTNYSITVDVTDSTGKLLSTSNVDNIWHTPSCRDNRENCESDCGCKCDPNSGAQSSGTCAAKCGYPNTNGSCQAHTDSSKPYTMECGKGYTFKLHDLDAGGAVVSTSNTVTIPPCATATPAPSGQCQNIQAFDTNWAKITDLSKLKAGDKVRFTAAGSTTAGTFDKARFTINGTLRPEVTQKKPTTGEFFDEYTIPAGTTTFSVKAEVHHSTLGWL